MDHAPADWHDIAEHHDMGQDVRYRKALIEKGIYHFPLPTKQGSISAAHTEADIDRTLELTAEVLHNGPRTSYADSMRGFARPRQEEAKDKKRPEHAQAR
jgi:hypothetical protein